MPKRSAGVSVRKAFRVRSAVDHASHIAEEMRDLVRQAAGDAAGRTIKAQQNAAADNLRLLRGHWRIRAAWNGEAGSWSAAAVKEFRDRFSAWKQDIPPAPETESVLRDLREALTRADADFFEAFIDAIRQVLRNCAR